MELVKGTKEVVALRKTLHRQLVRRMRALNLCTSDKVVEAFKRWYLWDYFEVETSRALSGRALLKAIGDLEQIEKHVAVSSILTKYSGFESERDLQRCSDGQVRNILAVGKYQLKLNIIDLRTYLGKSVHRTVYKWDLTVEEAHHCIKRLEEWEMKEIKRGLKCA